MVAGQLCRLRKVSNLSLFFRCQFNVQRGPIVLEVFDLLGPWDGDDIPPLLPQPGEGKLRHRAALLVSQRLVLLGDLDILLPVAVMETRNELATHIIAFGERIAAGKSVG